MFILKFKGLFQGISRYVRTLGVEKHIQEIQGSSRIPKPPISLLQLVIHVVKKKNVVLERMELDKNLTSFKIIISFVCLVSVHLLLSSMEVLYHVNDSPSC